MRAKTDEAPTSGEFPQAVGLPGFAGVVVTAFFAVIEQR
jgi:hypothetical protein